MKKFFDIKEDKYVFEISDLTALITILNVLFIVMGFWWAPILGLVNCTINLIVAFKNHLHINLYIMQVAFIVLNVYFYARDITSLFFMC